MLVSSSLQASSRELISDRFRFVLPKRFFSPQSWFVMVLLRVDFCPSDSASYIMASLNSRIVSLMETLHLFMICSMSNIMWARK